MLSYHHYVPPFPDGQPEDAAKRRTSEEASVGKESDKFNVTRRRKNKFRMRRRAQKVYPDWHKAWQNGDHIKVCSCWMCGNPRRHLKSKEGLTLAERRVESLTDSVACL
ncbi:hypothetical protein IV102_05715 [bacterium]|nr:hypothetical protein [bacterium]